MINLIKPALTVLISAGLALSVHAAETTEPLNLDQLLLQLEQGKLAQSKVNQSREQRFIQQKQNQEVFDSEIKSILAWRALF